MFDLHRQEISEKDEVPMARKEKEYISGYLWVLGYLCDCVYHEAAGLFTIHETFGNSISSQDLIAVRRQKLLYVSGEKALQQYH